MAVARISCNRQEVHSIYQLLAMAHDLNSGSVCARCGSTNSADSERCANCNASLDTVQESGASFVDDDPALRYVDSNNRVELDRFERMDEAELACGMLRANGIACELSPMPLPGLPADIILWVHNQDAELAWALLADVERDGEAKKDDAA